MIEASQRMLRINSQGELGGMSPPIKKHLELEIETIENAPRDADKLRQLLQIKHRQKEEAMRNLKHLIKNFFLSDLSNALRIAFPSELD